jgi:hypothetical protein
MMKAFSLLTVKSIEDERREFSGIASTPTVDRMGDVVDPMGAVFKTPMPLLLYHQDRLPVGSVDFAKPQKDGIPFRASIPTVAEAGTVKERVDEAWHSIKYKLLGCVSIGFQPLKYEPLDPDNPWDGFRFLSWSWLELSLCAIPANPDAVIQGFKSMDAHAIRQALALRTPDTTAPAATGTKRGGVILLPGASGKSTAAKRGGVPLISKGS